MRILPVIDLLNEVVVRGVAGQRGEYQPIESCIVATAEPLDVARSFRGKLGLTELYVADLDAIQFERPSLPIYRSLCEDGFEILIDAGLRSLQLADDILATGAAAVIAGLETITGPQQLRQLIDRFGPDGVIFSLDMQDSSPLGNLSEWDTSDVFEIASQAIDVGVTRMIVLDLASVGVGTGVPTIELCGRLKEFSPKLNVITGGGIRTIDDLMPLQDAGIDAVLIASAIHDGRIGSRELANL